MFLRKSVTLLMIFSSVSISVNAISCYQCNSADNPACDDLDPHHPHLTASFFKECNSLEQYNNSKPFCRKTVIEILLPRHEKRTTRSCGWIQYHRPCYKADNDGHLETSCQCFEDGCNGSSQLNVISAIFLLLLSFLCSRL